MRHTRKVPDVLKPPNILSVDVEDFFHVEAFSDIVHRENWDSYPCRVEANTRRILDLFDELGVTGTFFVLGWVAERYPRLVEEIARRGHETGSHSYWHRLIYKLSPEEFREDTQRSKDCVEQASGQPAIGYRAPSFSITARSAWALDILAELGFRYDSSVFPVRHDTYGVPSAPRTPFQVMTPSGPIVEFPMPTFRIGSSPNLPIAGGGYLRMLPFWYTAIGVHRAWREGLPVISYVHPWELDPGQPRLPGRLRSRARHYTGLKGMTNRLRKLIELGEFSSFAESGLLNSAALPHFQL